MNRFSIINNEKKCYVCGNTQNLHIHEIMFGRNRQNSIEDGLCIYLCGKHHNQSNDGVHFNHELDQKLKKIAEERWIKYYGKSTEDFIKRYGRNYL